MRKMFKKITSIVLVVALVFSAKSFDCLMMVYASATPSEVSEIYGDASPSETVENDSDEDTDEIYEEDDGEHAEEPEEASPSETEEVAEEEDMEEEPTASPSEIVEEVDETVDEATPSETYEETSEASPSEAINEYISVIEQLMAIDIDAAYLIDGKITFKKDLEINNTINVCEDTIFDFGGYTVKGTENADPVFYVNDSNVSFLNGNVYGKNGEDSKKEKGGDGGNAIVFSSLSCENTIIINEDVKVYGGNGGKGRGKNEPKAGAALTIGNVSIETNFYGKGISGEIGGGNGGKALYIIQDDYDFNKISCAKYTLIAGSAGLSSVKLFKSNVKFGYPSETKFDLRAYPDGKNYVTQIKSQSGNTCCFAYSVISQAESYMIMKYPDYVNSKGFDVNATKDATSWSSPVSMKTLTDRSGEFDLSESYLAMSTYKQPIDIYGNAGRSSAMPSSTWYNCGGAYSDMPTMLLSTPRAIVADNSTLEGYFNSASLPSDSVLDSYNDKVLAQTKSIKIYDYSGYTTNKAGFINELKTAVKQNCGAIISLLYTGAGNTTASGYTSYPVYYANNISSVNATGHAMNVIGWDDNIPKSSFASSMQSYLDTTYNSGNGAFIVKDSGGQFSLIPYGMSFSAYNGGIQQYSLFSSYEWEPIVSTYENTYYYDSGVSSTEISTDYAITAADVRVKYTSLYNVYKINNKKEKIKAISYYGLDDCTIDATLYAKSGAISTIIDDISNSDKKASIENITVHRGNNIIDFSNANLVFDDETCVVVEIHAHNDTTIDHVSTDMSLSGADFSFSTVAKGLSYIGEMKTGADSIIQISTGNRVGDIPAIRELIPSKLEFTNVNFRIKLLTNNYVDVKAGTNGKFSDDTIDDKFIYPTYNMAYGTLPEAKSATDPDNLMFIGYKDADNNVVDKDTKYKPEIAKTVVLTAQYISKPTISFTTDHGATPSDIKPNEYGIVTLPSISASGYTFNYWYKDDPGVAYDATKRLTDSTNFNLTAKWTVYTPPDPDPVRPHHYGGGSGGGGGGGGGGVRQASTPNQKTLATEVASTKQNAALAMWEKDAFGMWHISFDVAGQKTDVKNSWVGLETDVNLYGVVIKVVDYYFLDENGQMYTGWLTDAFGNKYFLDNSMGNEAGKMCFNTWKSIEGKQYYFGSDGKLVDNDTQNTQVGPII